KRKKELVVSFRKTKRKKELVVSFRKTVEEKKASLAEPGMKWLAWKELEVFDRVGRRSDLGFLERRASMGVEGSIVASDKNGKIEVARSFSALGDGTRQRSLARRPQDEGPALALAVKAAWEDFCQVTLGGELKVDNLCFIGAFVELSL
nr:hypothetical protein [Tanacetum cinerariifolium]